MSDQARQQSDATKKRQGSGTVCWVVSVSERRSDVARSYRSPPHESAVDARSLAAIILGRLQVRATGGGGRRSPAARGPSASGARTTAASSDRAGTACPPGRTSRSRRSTSSPGRRRRYGARACVFSGLCATCPEAPPPKRVSRCGLPNLELSRLTSTPNLLLPRDPRDSCLTFTLHATRHQLTPPNPHGQRHVLARYEPPQRPPQIPSHP